MCVHNFPYYGSMGCLSGSMCGTYVGPCIRENVFVWPFFLGCISSSPHGMVDG